MRLDVYGPLETVQNALHDIHADTATGNLGDLFRRAEAGAKDIFQGLRISQPGCFLRRRESEFDGFRTDAGGIHAAAVVADFDDYLIALVIRAQADRALGRLS